MTGGPALPYNGPAMRILVVEDDKDISGFVSGGLRQAGYAVDEVADGSDALAIARRGPYDLLIVDLMLPGLDGLALIDALRRDGMRAPVLILSARRSVDDRVRGLHAGGDDYLTKPFAFAELLARVQALLRRSSGTASTTTLRVADLELDLLKREATRGGRRIDLQPREFALLEYLMRNLGNVVSKTMILEHVWDYHFDPQTNVVDVLVHRLRSKVDRDFEPKLIQTVRGAGYALKVP
jgi:two-component system, OmpR family, response regulator